MERFDRAIATALRLIKKNGQLVDWLPQQKATDIDEPWKDEATEIEPEKVYICFLPVDKEMQGFLTYLKGTEVPIGSMVGLMGAVDFEPALGDTVIRDGNTLRPSYIELLSPNGQKILYTIGFNL